MKTGYALWRFLKGYGLVWLFVPMAAATLLVTMANQARATAVTARIAYWNLDETSGPVYADSVGSHQGVCVGSCPIADPAGAVNGGQAFDGVVDSVAVTADTAFDWGINDSFSIELWVKADSGQTCSGDDQVMIGRADSGAGDGFWSLGCAAATGVAQFQLGDSSGFSVTLESTRAITTGLWHHVAIARDGASHTSYLYVDGIEVISATQTYSGGFAPAVADINLGYLETGARFEGALDEVAIYDGVLSAAEIQTHYYLAHNYAAGCAAPVKIMPLGDSITKGSGIGTGYRQPLYISMTNAFYNVDFVGKLTHGDTAVPPFDYNHEGHAGWHADHITRGNILSNVHNLLTVKPADVILLHIGTNDILDGQDAVSLVPEVDQILDEIDRFDENTTVILAQIINMSNSFSTTVTAFNSKLLTMAQRRIAAGDKIIVVDHENALDYPADLLND
ncbi:MAG: hypothetical protein GY803_03695, partial [Chloroflexi bacterium]|nr:hypothetical protein [Chloroflexota bacterium]